MSDRLVDQQNDQSNKTISEKSSYESFKTPTKPIQDYKKSLFDPLEDLGDSQSDVEFAFDNDLEDCNVEIKQNGNISVDTSSESSPPWITSLFQSVLQSPSDSQSEDLMSISMNDLSVNPCSEFVSNVLNDQAKFSQIKNDASLSHTYSTGPKMSPELDTSCFETATNEDEIQQYALVHSNAKISGTDSDFTNLDQPLSYRSDSSPFDFKQQKAERAQVYSNPSGAINLTVPNPTDVSRSLHDITGVTNDFQDGAFQSTEGQNLSFSLTSQKKLALSYSLEKPKSKKQDTESISHIHSTSYDNSAKDYALPNSFSSPEVKYTQNSPRKFIGKSSGLSESFKTGFPPSKIWGRNTSHSRMERFESLKTSGNTTSSIEMNPSVPANNKINEEKKNIISHHASIIHDSSTQKTNNGPFDGISQQFSRDQINRYNYNSTQEAAIGFSHAANMQSINNINNPKYNHLSSLAKDRWVKYNGFWNNTERNPAESYDFDRFRLANNYTFEQPQIKQNASQNLNFWNRNSEFMNTSTSAFHSQINELHDALEQRFSSIPRIMPFGPNPYQSAFSIEKKPSIVASLDPVEKELAALRFNNEMMGTGPNPAHNGLSNMQGIAPINLSDTMNNTNGNFSTNDSVNSFLEAHTIKRLNLYNEHHNMNASNGVQAIPINQKSDNLVTRGEFNPEPVSFTNDIFYNIPTNDTINYRRLLEKSVTCNWRVIVNRIVRDNNQQASIFLQQKLKISNSQQRNLIIDSISEFSFELMVNRFGNFLIQRCLEYSNKEQIEKLTESIKGHVCTLSMDPFGCHVIQKVLDCVEETMKADIVQELLNNIATTMVHRYSCHVWQKLFELRWEGPAPNFMSSVNAQLKGMWAEVALEETGSLVVQNIFENCFEDDKRPCILEIIKNIDMVIKGQWGNWVIQHMIECASEPYKEQVISIIINNSAIYSVDQYASKVVEKLLKMGNKTIIQRFLDKVTEKNGRPRIPLIDSRTRITNALIMLYKNQLTF